MSELTEAWQLGHKGISFYTRTYQPPSGSPRAALVFIHGFIEHVGRYEHVHRRWADEGFFVFAFDQRGFGRTALDEKKSRNSVYGQTNDADQIHDIEWAVRVVQEANPTVPLFLMGHSMVRIFLHLLAVIFKFVDGSVYRAVHWYSHSRHAIIRWTPLRIYQGLLRLAPVFVSPNLH